MNAELEYFLVDNLHFLRSLPDRSVPLLLADPWYGIGMTRNDTTGFAKRRFRIGEARLGKDVMEAFQDSAPPPRVLFRVSEGWEKGMDLGWKLLPRAPRELPWSLHLGQRNRCQLFRRWRDGLEQRSRLYEDFQTPMVRTFPGLRTWPDSDPPLSKTSGRLQGHHPQIEAEAWGLDPRNKPRERVFGLGSQGPWNSLQGSGNRPWNHDPGHETNLRSRASGRAFPSPRVTPRAIQGGHLTWHESAP